MKHWAGNYEYRATTVHSPKTIEEVREIVARSSRVHALGSCHSFNDVADAAGGDLISLKALDRALRLDRDPSHPTVTVEAGITYGQLCPYLQSAGYALPNLASLPHISAAGACATATHGSGDDLQTLAAAVSALKLVDAGGDIIEVSRQRDGALFDGMVVSLGGLGVVTELTLDLVDSFELQQQVYENLPFSQVKSHFDEITRSAYSVSLFTDWQNKTFNQVWFKSRPGTPHFDLRSLGAALAAEQRHPAQGGVAEQSLGPLIDPRKCTAQLGEPGPWHTRLPHFRAEDEPSSSGEELQTEYVVPREHAIAVLEALFGLSEQIRPLIQISEVRTIAGDRLWMSPFFGRPSVAIHFTWWKDPPAVEALLPEIEQQLEPFQARPHWGKLFRMESARLQSLYPKLANFRELLRAYDPGGKFRNGFLDRYVGGRPDLHTQVRLEEPPGV